LGGRRQLALPPHSEAHVPDPAERLAAGQPGDGDLMPLLRRRGFTLIELMVALVLLAIVAGGIYQVLVTNQQTYLAQTQRIDLQQNLRAGVTILPADFRELDPADGDIPVMPTWVGGTFNVAGAITNGSPLRGYHAITYQLYQASDGKWYVGQQDNSAGGSLQPLIGPVASNGLQFTYYDAAGAITAVPTQVASIGITLIGQTASPIRQANAPGVAYKTDTVTTRVAVRNNPRCGPCK